MPTNDVRLLRTIRVWLAIFIAGLVLSGITAFPLQNELSLLNTLSNRFNLAQHLPALSEWIARVHTALTDTGERYPFLAYGTDWLAFGHLVIAAAFVLPWRDPIRYQGIITWGLIACAGVLPLALIAGPIRGIPVYWRLIDSSFGLFGCLPLLLIRRRLRQYTVLTQHFTHAGSNSTEPAAH